MAFSGMGLPVKCRAAGANARRFWKSRWSNVFAPSPISK
jgi:hypothetical protein